MMNLAVDVLSLVDWKDILLTARKHENCNWAQGSRIIFLVFSPEVIIKDSAPFPEVDLPGKPDKPLGATGA